MKILLILFFISCSQIKPINEKTTTPDKVSTNPEIILSEAQVYNGKVEFIDFAADLKDGRYFLHCTENESKNPMIQKIPFQVSQGRGFLYYAESYFSIAKSHECLFKGKTVLNIFVNQFKYAEERLRVAKGKVHLSKENLERVAKERKITAKLYENSFPELLINKPFQVPLNSYITSRYGKRRIFNNSKKAQHLGNDFRARVGVKIPSSNRGKVVYVGDLFYTGNVVIVDHGLNIFTFYAHLSKTLVSVGDMIDQGDIVGLSGRTGRVSGPHLHWGVKINGHNVDGFSLVEESEKQFHATQVH